jgi:hypothetical protein
LDQCRRDGSELHGAVIALRYAPLHRTKRPLMLGTLYVQTQACERE